MPNKSLKRGGGAPLLVIAAALLLALPNGAGAAGLAEGQWAGTWYPGSSCRDTKERAITAEVAGGRIKGRVDNPHGRPGLFQGDIGEGGKFQANVHGLKSYSFTMFGQGGGSQASGRWTTRNDCGAGKFTLALVGASPSAAAPAQDESPRQLLDRLLRDGLITEAEYQGKLTELSGGQPAAQPVAAPAPAPAGDDARLQALQDLYSKGLISKADYDQKLSQLQAEQGVTATQAAPAADPRLQALQDLYNKGLISEEDYKRKAAEIEGASD